MEAVCPQDRYIEVNGVRLHYLDWGNPGRKTVLLLHGFLGHARVWDRFASKLCHDFRVLALDQRGHGRSQWSPDAAYSIDDHFSDLARFSERLGLGELIVVGHSMGGRNGLLFSACHPNRVSRLVLVDSRPYTTRHSTLALKHFLDSVKRHTGTFLDGFPGPRVQKSGTPRGISEEAAARSQRSTSGGGYDPRMIDQVERSNYFLEDLRPLMGGLSCPTLIIRGKHSSFLTRSEAEEMCRLMESAKYVEIPRSSHMPPQENPEDFQEAVLSFLKNA